MITINTPYFKPDDRVRSTNADMEGYVVKAYKDDRTFVKWDNGRSGWTHNSNLILIKRQ